MAQMILKDKVEVQNPALLLTRVGQELVSLYEQYGKDSAILGIDNLAAKERLTERQLKKAQLQLGLDEGFVAAMQGVQVDYATQKQAAKESLKQSLQYYRKLKKVLPLLKGEFEDGYDRLDDIVNFFGLDSEEEIFEHASRTVALYREQNRSKVDEINLSGWLRRGELDYMKVGDKLPEYDKDGLMSWIEAGEWRSKLKNATYFKELPKLLHQYGIVVTLIPYLSNTVYGAVKWMDGHPVVMVSDRGQDLASCWFTLFHEFGHVMLHSDVQTSVDGSLNESTQAQKDKREREANKFANKYLFNGDDLRKHIFQLKRDDNYETVAQIGQLYNVDEMFVGYWMHKAQYYPAAYAHHPISFAY